MRNSLAGQNPVTLITQTSQLNEQMAAEMFITILPTLTKWKVNPSSHGDIISIWKDYELFYMQFLYQLLHTLIIF